MAYWDDKEENLLRQLLLEDKLETPEMRDILESKGYIRSERSVAQRRITIFDKALKRNLEILKQISPMLKELEEGHKLQEIRNRNGNSKVRI